MSNSYLRNILKLLENYICQNSSVDKELVELIVNHSKIPYFRVDRDEKLITDILGIETRKITNNIYLVEKVLNDTVNYICPGDYVLAPRKLSEGYTKEKQQVDEYINVLKLSDYECKLQSEKVILNLRGKEEDRINEKGWEYIKIENFSSNKKINRLTEDNIVIDLRCNSGGMISDMLSTFEKIFDSKVKLYKDLNSGKMDFRANAQRKREKIYIIVDKTTCSSAEIFACLAKYCFDAVLVGTKMYGKNMLCKRRKLGDIMLHIPDKEYLVDGNSVLKVEPDFFINNICEYNGREIIDICTEIRAKRFAEKSELKEKERMFT